MPKTSFTQAMEAVGKVEALAGSVPESQRPATNAADCRPSKNGLFGYVRCNAEGVILEAGRTLARWLGLESEAALPGQRIQRFLQDQALWREWQTASLPLTASFCLHTADGPPVLVRAEVHRDSDASGTTEIWMVKDLNDALIARAASLEAALTLSAGTVHDVNNVLTVLSGNLFLLTESVRDQPRLYEQARRARNAAERGNRLLRELLTFDHGPNDEKKAISPADHVIALRPLLTRILGSEQTLETRIDEQPGTVLASSAQLESALINLVVNARDAIDKDGTVTVKVRRVRPSMAQQAELNISPGEYIRVEVIDNGSGIPEACLSQVTKPLFSTKPKGQGSGLGLAMVQRFADSCAGRLHIESAEGRGTAVGIWLPRSQSLAETTANMTRPLSTLPAGSEPLLLVVHDDDVRNSMRQILETLGYEVTATATAREAAKIVAGPRPPVLVISDQESAHFDFKSVAGNQDGTSRTTVRQLALLQADADPNEVARHCEGHIYQPISVPELARTVRNAIEGK